MNALIKLIPKNILSTSVRTVFIAAFLWIAFKNFSEDDFIKMAETVAAFPSLSTLLLFCLIFLAQWMRVMRWKALLHKTTSIQPSTKAIYVSIMAGYGISGFVGQVGELVKPILLSRLSNVTLQHAIATVIIDRMLDVITFLLFLTISLFIFDEKLTLLFVSSSQEHVSFLLGLFKIVNIFLLVCLVLMFFFPKKTRILLIGFPKIIRLKAIQSILFFEQITKNLTSFRRFSEAFVISISLFFVYILFNYACIVGLGLDKLYNIDMFDMLVVYIATIVSVALTPSGVGVLQYSVTAALVSLYQVQKIDAAGYSLILFSVSFFGYGLFGVIVAGTALGFRPFIRLFSAGKKE